MLEGSISAYKDDAGRCSVTCPTHVALRAACIRCGEVAQRNHWDYIILPRCTFLLSLQKTSLFLPQRHCKSRTETSDITHTTSHEKPSQRASQRPHGRHITSHKSWIIIWSSFNPLSRRWIGLNAHSMRIGFKRIHANAYKLDWMCIRFASRCPCERAFTSIVYCCII